MTFNVNDMRGGLEFGGARNTLFNIDLVFPVGVDNVQAARKVTIMAKAASLPATEMGMIPVSYFGRVVKFAGDRRYSSWTVTVINDEDFKIRHAMESWTQKINSIQANLAGYERPLEYKVDVNVNQFAKNGRLLRTYRMSGLFPVQTGAIDLDWSATDRIEEFQIAFEYDYHETVAGTTGLITG